jgi:mannose PTS system EIIC component
MVDPLFLLLLAGIGGLLALDGSGVGQVMISRPLVAATIGGWLAGMPAEGAMIGLVLEALHLSVLPFGAATVPESGPSCLIGGWLFAVYGPGPAALLTISALVLALGWVGGESVRRLRHLNARVAIPEGVPEVEPTSVERRQMAAVGLDFLRGAVLTAVGAVTLFHLARFGLGAWEGMPGVAALGLGIGVVASLAASTRFFEARRIRLAVGGAAVGLLLLVLA